MLEEAAPRSPGTSRGVYPRMSPYRPKAMPRPPANHVTVFVAAWNGHKQAISIPNTRRRVMAPSDRRSRGIHLRSISIILVFHRFHWVQHNSTLGREGGPAPDV